MSRWGGWAGSFVIFMFEWADWERGYLFTMRGDGWGWVGAGGSEVQIVYGC